MAFAYTIALLACFLVLHLWSVTSNLLSISPLLSPNFDDVCKEAVCGKGTCKPSQNTTFPFVCECEPGWKQARPDHDDSLKFIPCVIPNCTLDYSCGNARSPAPDKQKPANNSFFDPCSWSYCGEGTCNKKSTFTHTCDCKEGFYNLFNVTSLPCFKDCALGMDCSRLGINVMNNSSPPPALADNSNNNDDVCKEAVCGKGTCKPSQNTTFPFICECEPGWKQARPDYDDSLKFFPCVIPNCTLDYSCGNAPSPAPDKQKPANNSFFDTCSWSYCGEGTCNKKSAFTHTCDCKEGFYNLLNVTSFPCFRDCALGMDCSKLGINVRNNSSPPPASADNSNNQDSTRVHGYFNWLILISLLVAAILWS